MSFEIESTEDIPEAIQHPLCDSAESEFEGEQDVVPQGKKRNKFNWRTHSTYNNLDDALLFLEDEGFVCYDNSDLKCGQKFYFRCKRVPKKRTDWCALRYTIFLPSDNLSVLLLDNACEHNHDKILEGSKHPPSDGMVEYMEGLFKCGTTGVSEVHRHIELARKQHGLFTMEGDPDRRQIEYALRQYRDAQDPKMISIGDLMSWPTTHS